MEALPGIAAVLRSPVADAFVGVIRAAARLGEFAPEHAEEILGYAVRRNLMTEEETEQVLAEVRGAVERKAERDRGRKAAAGARVKAKAKATAKAKPVTKAKPKPRPKAKAKAKTKAAGRTARKLVGSRRSK
jgi:septal ring-binding cell division protein DamX